MTRMRFVLFVMACLALSPALAQSSPLTQDTLARIWNLKNYTDHQQDQSFTTKVGDVLHLRADSTFTLLMAADTVMENGTWEWDGDSLVLYFELIPITSGIDSLVYQANDNKPGLIFFYQGEEVARQDLKGLASKRRSQRFKVSLQGPEEALSLVSAERSMQASPRVDLIREAFSFMDIVRGLIGIAFLLGVSWFFSTHRSRIDWRMVGTGIGLQLIFAILVLKVPGIREGFSYISEAFVTFLNFTLAGSSFLLGFLVDPNNPSYVEYVFAFQVGSIIIFFSAITSLLYYLGVLQRIVYGFAWVMKKAMRLSGAESLAAAGNIFLGQTESPLLIKPYLETMTRSEIMALMTGGMATIAGSVFGAYIGYLGGNDPQQAIEFATHLLTASIMSAPAALVAAKMLVPETEETLKDLSVPKERIGSNALDSIANGATEGLKLAVNVIIMLLVFLAFIAAINFFLANVIGHYTGLNEWVVESTGGKFTQFGLEYLFGLFLAPIAWLLGVPSEDIMAVGQLLGEKTIANEFVAYSSLGVMKAGGAMVHYKSVIIATYALCGFANFSSIGIQIGGIGALAPNQRKTLSELGIRALIGGTIAAFMTAVLAGMLLNI